MQMIQTNSIRNRDFAPAAANCSNGFEAARCKLEGACVAAIHSPVEEVDLVSVELQEQDDNFTAQLMDLTQKNTQNSLDFMPFSVMFILKYLKILHFCYKQYFCLSHMTNSVKEECAK